MPSIRVFSIALALVAAGALGACSDAGGKLRGGSGPADANGGSVDGPPPEEAAYRVVETDLKQKCGNTCHELGEYKPTPATFLAGPDSYKSVKAQPGVVLADYYQSILLQKGAHAGPAVGNDPTFEAKLIEWLKAESAVIQSQKKPTTDPVVLANGPNDLDMSKACISGLTGVHLKFDASLVGGILSLSNLKVATAAGTDVHVYKPKFIKVLAKPDATNRREIPDGAESFSNTDQTIAGGTEAILTPGSAFFTAQGWTPFDFGTDRIRIEVEKLEPGKVQVIQAPKVCKNVAGFTNNVLPSMRGAAGGFNLTCSDCHGNGLAGMSLNGGDQALICNQVLQKLNEGNIAASLIVTKVITGPHQGGTINDPAGWTALFNNNKAVFF